MSSCIFISSSSEENQDYLKLVDSIKEGFDTNLPLFDSDNKPTKELFQSLERSVARITGQFKTGNRDILAQAISKALFDLELAPGTIDNIREFVDKDIISKFVTKYAKLIEYKPQFLVNKFSDSLDTLFLNYTDINRFRNQFRGNLTNRFFITSSGKIVKTNEDFNSSIQNYKQDLFDALRSRALAKIKDSDNIEDVGLRLRLLKYNLANPGVDNRLITQDIERMLKLVESSFKLVNGKFTSGDFGLYSQYVSFKYFDQLIEQLLGDSISINPISNRYFKSSGKYTRNLGQQVNQRFEDDTISYSDEANKVLMRFISSIRLPNGNYLNFNDFTAALHYIRTKFPDYIGQIRMQPSLIRDLWRKAVEKANLDSKVANNIKNAITAIYGRVYSDAENSLYNLYKSEGNVKYNLYTFINNSINSATPARYLSTGINEDGEAETKEMTQVVNQTRINSIASAIMLATKKNTFTNVGLKLGISKITNDYDKLTGFLFSDFKLLFNGKTLALVTKDGNELTSAKNKASYIRDHSETFRNLLTDILNRPMSQEYWKQLLISDDADISGLLDLAVAALISYDYNENIVNNEDDMLTMTGRLLDTLDRNKMPLEPKKIGKLLDFTTKMVNPRAIFKATDGLFAINAANDYFNGNLNKSYIVDSTGAHLPLMTVTSAMADDKIIVSKIKSDAMHPFYSNLFYNLDLIGESFINQEFVTKDGRSKTIASMTAQELGYYDFVYRYLLAGDTMYFQPTVYSDKSRIWVKPLYLNKPINTNIAELEDINTKTLNELNIDDIKRVHRFTMKNLFNKYIDTYNKNLVLVVNKVLERRREQPLKAKDYFSNIKAANNLSITPAELNNAILELQNNGQEVELFHEAQFKEDGSVITFGNSNLDFYNSYFSDEKVYNLKNSIEDKLYAFLLQDNDINIFTVNSDGTLNERLDSIAKSQPEWYDENTKKMMMYRVKQNGVVVNKDLTIDDCFDSKYSIEFNPIVERYLALNRLAQDNYNAMLFGFSFAHKGKTLKNWYNMSSITYEAINDNRKQLLEEESSRQTAEWKRGVIGGATIHPVAQGLLNGVPSTYKIACIEDLSDKLITWHVSDMGKGVNNLPVTPHDGGIFINPFISVLENNSMPDIKVSDVAKKPIVHIDLSKVGMAGLLKCATFSLNNEYIRNSEAKTEYDADGIRLDDRLNGKDLLARMADIQWESFPPINKTYTDLYYYNTVEHKYFRVVKIQQVSNSLYDVVIKEVDNKGNNINKESTTKHININSNYDLWDALGGEWSCSKVDGELVLSESSIDEVVNIMNNYNVAKEGTTADSPKTQEYYNQPMKDANIAYLVNRSAFKNGPANVSPTEKFFQPYQKIGKYSIPYQTIETTWLGIQLNAEHDLEDSHITEMSQVISALEQGGITHDIAIVIYKNIGRTIANYLETYYKEANLDDPAANAVAQVFSDLEKREKLYFILGSKLISAYASRDNSIGLTQAYLNSVRDSIEREKIENDTPLIPFNDPNICQVLQTAFTSGLNRDIIRRTYDGVAAVQAPSSNLVTIYDTPQGPMKYTDLVMSSKSSTEFIKKMNGLDREVDSRDVQIGDYVLIIYANGAIKKGRVSGYRNPNGIGLIDLLNLEDGATVTLLGSKGRGLRSENATFNLEGLSKKLSLYDLDSSRLSWELYDLLKVSKDETFDDFYNNLDDYNKARITDILFRLYGTDEGDLGFKTAITKYLNSDKSNYKNIAGFLNESLQKEFNNLETGAISIPVLYRKDLNDRTPVAVTSINRQANEIMVGKLWAKEFGLKKGDNLYLILNEGPEFFKNRLKDRYTIPLDEDKFDMVYTKPDGNHLYVITDANRIRQIYRNDFINFTIDNKARYTYINGKKYYVKDNQPQYPIPNDAEIYHYTDNKIVYDIVYIPDGKLERFNKDIESTNQYTGLWVSSTSNQKNALVKMPSKLMNKQLANYLVENKSFLDLRNLELEQTAQKMYISFKQATNFIGGRIPSQSMQSFINCKVAGYIDMDSNIVWVNNAVLVFQGSDFDIDKLYMLGAGINRNGIYESWSDLFDYSDDTFFDISNLLPIPENTENYTLIYLNDIPKGDRFIANYETYINPMNDAETRHQAFQEIVDFINYLTDHKIFPNISLNEEETREEALDFLETHFNTELSGIRLDKALKNRTYYNIIKSGNSIKNWIKQTDPISIKDASDAAEVSPTGLFSKYLSITNPMAKFNILYQNSIGKQGIGISATGMKVLSLISTYVHELMMRGVSPNDLKIKIRINGTRLETLEANGIDLTQTDLIPNLNIDLIPDLELRNKFKELTLSNTKDYVNEDTYGVESMLVTISTDNAKELVLDKINGSPELLGTYIYGVLTGIPFSNMVKFMTSAIVNQVAKLAKKNIFNDSSIYNSIQSAINYYMNGINTNAITPNVELGNGILNLIGDVLKEHKAKFVNNEELYDSIRDGMDIMQVLDLCKTADINTIIELVADPKNNYKVNSVSYSKYTKSSSTSSDEEFADFGDLGFESFEDIDESEFGGYNRDYDDDSFKANPNMYLYRYLDLYIKRNQLLNSLEEDRHPKEGLSKTQATLDILGKLNLAAQEITVIGRGGSLNQGIKTKLVEKINFEEFFNRYFNKMFEKYSKNSIPEESRLDKPMKFDFIEFCQNSDYAALMTDQYEKAKYSFNILDIWRTVPHFWLMFRTNGVDDYVLREFMPVAYGFAKDLMRTSIDRKLVKSNDMLKLKRIDRFIPELLVYKYFKSNPDIICTVPAGYQVYNNKGYKVTSVEPTQLDFTKPEHIATFKSIMENEILNLLRNKYLTETTRNKFIEDIQDAIANDGFFNSYTYIRLPFGSDYMDSETNDAYFDLVLSSFNDIKDAMIPEIDMTIQDAFFLYNLITNSNRNGSNTFTKLFVDTIKDKDSLAYKYTQFLAKTNYDNDFKFAQEDIYFRLLETNQENSGLLKKFNRSTKSYDYYIGGNLFRLNNFNGAIKLPVSFNSYSSSQILDNDRYKIILELADKDLFELKLECDE